MSFSRVLLGAVTILLFAAALFFKQQFLSASERDLMSHVEGLEAAQFHLPKPGQAYAYNAELRQFDPSPVCWFQQTGSVAAGREEKPTKGINLAGESYNAALEGAGGFVGEKIIEVIRAKDTQRMWLLEAHFQRRGDAKFDASCLQEADTVAMLGTNLVYIVDTVYYRSGEDIPFLVRFKSNPVILACDGDCARPSNQIRLHAPDRITKIKSDWGLIQFSLLDEELEGTS